MSLRPENRETVDSVVLEVSKIVSEMAGIQLGKKQASMVENRLRTRMVRLAIDDFTGYLKYLVSHKESESQALLSLMTTHHTYFFREFSHFEYLLNHGLDALVQKAKARGDYKIRIWSAALSRGQEMYSLAMFFNFHLKAMNAGVDFEIWGTDIDPESVDVARNGVYRAEELKQSPAMYIQDNWIRGTGQVKDFSKVKDHLKQKCKFATANLLNAKDFLKDKNFDVIFCRNVFIYFNQEQIKSCTSEMLNHLDPEGFLFLGVSESLLGLGLKVDSVGPSVYRHPQSKSVPAERKRVVPLAPALEKKILEVLCVDDSKAIHALLGKILTRENGFVIKATATNGLEALELVKQQKFDVMTLDLHMPELDGVGFLTQSAGLDRPPVVVMSAINRDDPSIAQKALGLGAMDYVEKPSLENMAQAANEIRAKLKLVYANSPKSKPVSVAIQKGPSSNRKKVLIVDDSKTIRTLLEKIISNDPQLEVVASAERPSQVEELIKQHKPDVITLDINMPEMDGIALLKKIHPKYQIPTVMISSISKEEGTQVLDALEAGAIDYIQKPQANDMQEVAQQIRDRIKTAANATIRKRKKSSRVIINSSVLDMQSLIVIGASTGGTEALKDILVGLPKEIPPILIVQHIPPVFSAAFAKRLNDLCPFEVREAKHGDEIKANQVLIAPGGTQMGVKALRDKVVVNVNDDAPVNRHKPSVDYLFASVANLGSSKVVACLLTGMGADGARMMKKLRDQKIPTIAQNQETCVVFGMPKEAIAQGGAEYILPLDEIGQKVMDLCSGFGKRKSA